MIGLFHCHLWDVEKVRRSPAAFRLLRIDEKALLN
mgnify:CR=1 FL=1